MLMVSYVEDGLYGCDPEVLSSPVLRVCIHAFLQDVEFPAEPRLLKRHPPATTTSQGMKAQPPCFSLYHKLCSQSCNLEKHTSLCLGYFYRMSAETGNHLTPKKPKQKAIVALKSSECLQTANLQVSLNKSLT